MTRVLVVGVAVMDFVFYVEDFPSGGTKNRAHDSALVGGGCGANAAVAIARLGGDAALASRLGADPLGKMICEELEAEGVDLSATDRSGARSSFSSILVDARGERQIMNYRGDGLLLSPDHLANTSGFQAVLADTRWPEGALAAMELARARGVPGVLDVEALSEVDAFGPASHLAFSEQGLSYHYPDVPAEQAIAQVAKDYGGWVCVTTGETGLFWNDGMRAGCVPGYEVEVLDTLGAGDIWHGAFSLGLAEGQDEIDAARFANAVAALKCTRLGGRAGSPTLSLIHISEPTRPVGISRMPSSA